MSRLRFSLEIDLDDKPIVGKPYKLINVRILNGAIESHAMEEVAREAIEYLFEYYETRHNEILVSDDYVNRMPDTILDSLRKVKRVDAHVYAMKVVKEDYNKSDN
jgi:nitrogen regulatory protein PII